MLPFACLATNNPELRLCETKIFPLCGSHKFLHVTPQGVALMPQDECKVDTAQKRSVCTIFGPRIARNEVPFFILCQLLTYPLAKCPLSRIVL